MICYALKINGKFFKGYEYAVETTNGRYAGNLTTGGILNDDDITGVILTDTPERKETKRSIGNTIRVIYGI